MLKCIATLGALSHVGKKRFSNQDSFCALVGSDAPNETDVLLAVADGMGGHRAGEIASEMAIVGLIAKLSYSDCAVSASDYIVSNLTRTIMELNKDIFYAAAAAPETRGMGTTLTAALIVGNVMTIGQVGDSKAYLLRNGKIRQLTQDHNWLAELQTKGLFDYGQMRANWARSILTRAIGLAPNVDVDSATIEAMEGDVLLICSDGVHSEIGNDELVGLLANYDPQPSSRAIVDLANTKGGHDNITAVVCRIDGLVPQPVQRQL